MRGTGWPSDIILKDRYWHVWALTDRLEPLWDRRLNTGHYPFPYDVDGDGRDELAIGYSLVDDDGTLLWSYDDRLQDHADGVAIVRFRDDQEPRLLCAASDEGLYFADLSGRMLSHLQLGHVQNPSTANFRPDLPGLETVSINFWGNQGIVHFFDADGRPYHDFEPAQHGSMMLPLNWTGSGTEYWVLSPSSSEGGMFDGWGRRVLRFPADGHPDLAAAVLDLTGDAVTKSSSGTLQSCGSTPRATTRSPGGSTDRAAIPCTTTRTTRRPSRCPVGRSETGKLSIVSLQLLSYLFFSAS